MKLHLKLPNGIVLEVEDASPEHVAALVKLLGTEPIAPQPVLPLPAPLPYPYQPSPVIFPPTIFGPGGTLDTTRLDGCPGIISPNPDGSFTVKSNNEMPEGNAVLVGKNVALLTNFTTPTSATA